MEKSEYFKKSHEESMIIRRYTSSDLVLSFSKKYNFYDEKRQIETTLKSEAAASLANATDFADGTVARGITLGIELAKTEFPQAGEAFLMAVIPGYRSSDLGVALTKVMLEGLEGERVEKIISGVAHVLTPAEPLTEEEKAAVAAIEIYEVTNKLNTKQNDVYSALLLDAIHQTRKNKTVSYPEIPRWQTGKESPVEKNVYPEDSFMPRILEANYAYYLENPSEIPSRFSRALGDMAPSAIAAYYVVSLPQNRLVQNVE